MTSKIYKTYIGYTKKTLVKRFSEHCNPRSKNAYKMPIVKAIKKYGEANFKIELLEENEDDKYIHLVRENYWIEKLKARNQNTGYNLLLGGNDGGFYYWNNGKINRRSQVCPDKDFVRGMLVTEKSRLLRSTAHKGQKSAFKGKHHTEETKQKLKLLHKGLLTGEKNPSAKVFKIISPTGQMYIIKGTAKEFCIKNNLSYAMFRKYKNKGPCKASKFNNKSNSIAKNTVGWIFKEIN